MKHAHLKIWLGEQVWRSKVSSALIIWGFCEYSSQSSYKDLFDKYMQNHYVEAYLANRNYISSTKQVNLFSPSILFWCVMSVSHTDGVTLRVSAQRVHVISPYNV